MHLSLCWMWPFYIPIQNRVYSLQLILHLSIVTLMELEKAVSARCPLFVKLENIEIRRDQSVLFLIWPLKELRLREGKWLPQDDTVKNWPSQNNSALLIPNPEFFLKCLLNCLWQTTNLVQWYSWSCALEVPFNLHWTKYFVTLYLLLYHSESVISGFISSWGLLNWNISV